MARRMGVLQAGIAILHTERFFFFFLLLSFPRFLFLFLFSIHVALLYCSPVLLF